MAGLLVVGGLMLGCSVTPPASFVGPTFTPPPSTSASQPVASPAPTPTPWAPPTPPPTLIALPIDARRVISTAGIDCTGGPLGGEASESTSYDVWTLHCPAGPEAASQKLVDALKAEVELLGAAIQDEGEIVSHNAGNDGDRQVTLHYGIEGIDVNIRVTSLKAQDGAVVVVTIDQRRL